MRPAHLFQDHTFGNSKSFAVPASNGAGGGVWQVVSASLHMATSANAGTRLTTFQILDTTNTVIFDTRSPYDLSTGADQYILAIPGGTFFVDSGRQHAEVPLPNPCILPAGFTLKALDTANVDSTADRLSFDVLYISLY